MRISPFITLIFLFVLGACTKFEEGPGFSLRTRTNRIAGVWTIQSYEIDGVDSLSSLQNIETLTYVFGGVKCGRNIYGRNCTQCANITAEWGFSNNLTNHLWMDNVFGPLTYSYYPVSQQVSDLWEIKHLSNKKMILQSYAGMTHKTVRLTMTKENNDRPCE